MPIQQMPIQQVPLQSGPLQSGPLQQVKLTESSAEGTGEYPSSALLGAPVSFGRGPATREHLTPPRRPRPDTAWPGPEIHLKAGSQLRPSVL